MTGRRYLWCVLVSALMIACLLAFLTEAKAQSCTAIQNYDKRQECFARERGDPDGCTSIRNYDQREECRQRARRSRSERRW